MEIGRKIYFTKDTGVVIWDKGEMEGSVIETTFEEDCISMPVLTLIPTEKLGVVQYEFGHLIEQFSTSKGYIIDPITEEPVFAE